MQLLPILLFAVQILAVRISYSCKYDGQGMAQPQRKSGGTVSDADGQQVVNNMATWSNDRYTASYSTSVPNLINVACAQNAASKSAASDNVNNMQQCVNHMGNPCP